STTAGAASPRDSTSASWNLLPTRDPSVLPARGPSAGSRAVSSPGAGVISAASSGPPGSVEEHDGGCDSKQPADHRRSQNDPDERGAGRPGRPAQLHAVRVGGDEDD